jgi:FKBP-type peptidyl-prolyl cis-trans isomerase SlyD
MKETIEDDKFVELNYQVIDKKTSDVLVKIEYPLGYVHGSENDVLAKEITMDLEGKSVGDFLEVPIDCNQLYGPRDESLVFTDAIENVPEEYREVGLKISMENAEGKTKDFLVTRVDEKSVTVDGNNPLCGREVVFKLEVLSIRDATEEEIEIGGALGDEPDINEILKE